MKDKKKICVVTGSRAEYGLLYWLMKEIEATDELELQIVATGMHLSPEFGLTYKLIEQDGFNIDYKVEMLLSSDTDIGVSKSIGLGIIGFTDVFVHCRPDLLILLGDRFEIFSAASAATIAGIAIAHIHGGETTEGAIDEVFRHSLTKMSHLHFTATEKYRNRVIQLGEHPDRVFNVGGLGIDNINRLSLLSRDSLEKSLGFKMAKHNLLITFHPVTLEKFSSEEQFNNLLTVLNELKATHFLFTKANADTNGRKLNQMIDSFVASYPEKASAFTSMGQLNYLSSMQYVDGVVGNSSSGLLEAPSFKIGTINIGDRQKGRVKAESVLDCEPTVDKIRQTFDVLFSQSFNDKLKTVVNPYGQGGAVEKIVKIIKEYPLEGVLKKEFFDLEGIQ